LPSKDEREDAEQKTLESLNIDLKGEDCKAIKSEVYDTFDKNENEPGGKSIPESQAEEEGGRGEAIDGQYGPMS
jgi:hypothetical protein